MTTMLQLTEWLEIIDAPLLRLNLPSTQELGKFQLDMKEKMDSLMKQGELAGFRASFQWWTIQGMWPGPGDSWVLLLVRTTFEGTAAGAAAAKARCAGYRP
jgi:hypothetical protein